MGRICEEVVAGSKRATKRDEWIAFHRLYRMATKGSFYQEMGAVQSLWILFPYSWVALVEKDAKQISRSHFPKIIRRNAIKCDRMERLYNRNQQTKDECRHVARMMAEKGIECTPDEVAEVRYKVLKMLRERSSHPLPESDQLLMNELRRAYHQNPPAPSPGAA